MNNQKGNISSKEKKFFTKEELKERNKKGKYSDDEIAKKRHIDSRAKFIVRDSISNSIINTSGKWIAVDLSDDVYDSFYSTCSNYFEAELFDKKMEPEYKEYMSEEEKHELTYNTAEDDIAKQRKKGISGPRYGITYKRVQNDDGKYDYEIDKVEKLE